MPKPNGVGGKLPADRADVLADEKSALHSLGPEGQFAPGPWAPPVMLSILTPGSFQNGGDGSEENPHVEQITPDFNILAVESHRFFE
jgi:hypothetical protein